MSDDLRRIARNAEVVLLELRELAQGGPVIRIAHRFHRLGTDCQAGEEVWAVYLVFRVRELPLRMTLAIRLLIDYLARTRHVPQSATQIAAGMRESIFYRCHGGNGGTVSQRSFSRSAIKEYVKRARKSLDITFREAKIQLDSRRVLVSRNTVGKEKLYQLRARIEWLHLD
jgi:hypothetical protein